LDEVPKREQKPRARPAAQIPGSPPESSRQRLGPRLVLIPCEGHHRSRLGTACHEPTHDSQVALALPRPAIRLVGSRRGAHQPLPQVWIPMKLADTAREVVLISRLEHPEA